MSGRGIALRRWAVGLGSAACSALIGISSEPQVVAAAAVALVYLSARSSFDWIRYLPMTVPASKITRRLLRSLVLLAAAPFLPMPKAATSSWAYLVGALVGVLALAGQRAEIVESLRPERLRRYPPLDGVDRFRDVAHFAIGGGAQEYLYRYVVLIAFTPALGAGVVVLSTALFVVEHQVHLGAVWDRKDLTIHTFLGLALGAVAYAAGSVWPAVIGHTIYNSPNVLFTLRRPRRIVRERPGLGAPGAQVGGIE